MKFKTPWQTCTHPLSERSKLAPIPEDDEGPESSGRAYQQYDCLCCGSMLTEYVDHDGTVLKTFAWVPPEDGDGVLP